MGRIVWPTHNEHTEFCCRQSYGRTKKMLNWSSSHRWRDLKTAYFRVRSSPVFEALQRLAWELLRQQRKTASRRIPNFIAFKQYSQQRQQNYRFVVIYAVKSRKNISFGRHEANDGRWRGQPAKNGDSINRNYWIYFYCLWFGIWARVFLVTNSLFNDSTSRMRTRARDEGIVMLGASCHDYVEV